MGKKRGKLTRKIQSGIYEYRGYRIVKKSYCEWEVFDNYGKLAFRSRTLIFSKEKIDDIVKFRNDLFNKKRYE